MDTETYTQGLYDFAIESNKIEGIKLTYRHKNHSEALEKFLAKAELDISALEEFVHAVQPRGGRFRVTETDMVQVGTHIAPAPAVMKPMLEELLKEINTGSVDEWNAHARYEVLHPFMDGNGRSGRAIWLWMAMKKGWEFKLSFLQMYYYQTLSNYRK